MGEVFIFGKKLELLSIPIKGKIISYNRNIIQHEKNGIKKITIINKLGKDIFIFGETTSGTILYKVKKGQSSVRRYNVKKIIKLYYILNDKKYQLKHNNNILKYN